MKLLFAAAAVTYLVILTIGAFSGRIRAARGCCTVADPAKDLRMRQPE